MGKIHGAGHIKGRAGGEVARDPGVRAGDGGWP